MSARPFQRYPLRGRPLDCSLSDVFVKQFVMWTINMDFPLMQNLGLSVMIPHSHYLYLDFSFFHTVNYPVFSVYTP